MGQIDSQTNQIPSLRTGFGSQGGPGSGPALWTATTDTTPFGGIDCAGPLRLQSGLTFFGTALSLSLVSGGTTTATTVVTTTGNVNQQIAKARVLNEALTPLSLSATTLFALTPGRAGTVNQITVSAVTKPTATASVTIQIFKNSTANAVTGIYDFNSITAGVAAVIPITGNSTLGATDFLFAQVVTGASLNSANGLGVSAEVLTTDY